MIYQYQDISPYETTVKFYLFPNFTIHYQKANPLGSEHPHQLNSNSVEYFDEVRNILVKNLTTGVIYHIFTHDERGFNIMHYMKNLKSEGTKDIADYIYKHFNAMKKESPEKYGTYINHSIGTEGRESLYLHDIFDYILKNQRINKLKTILND